MHLRAKNRSGVSLDPSRQHNNLQKQRMYGGFTSGANDISVNDKLKMQYNSTSIPYLNKGQVQSQARRNRLGNTVLPEGQNMNPTTSTGRLIDHTYRSANVNAAAPSDSRSYSQQRKAIYTQPGNKYTSGGGYDSQLGAHTNPESMATAKTGLGLHKEQSNADPYN